MNRSGDPNPMAHALSSFVDEYMSPLLAGNRAQCREVVRRHTANATDSFTAYHELLWPAMERVDKLYRSDRINLASEHMATRINRAIADQLQLHLPKGSSNGKRMLILCADGEPEELGAQMCSDLLEAQGWDVYFLGGGVPNDEVMSLAGQLRPDILLIFGTQPGGVPGVRRLIDLIRGVGLNPTMNIIVSGGVFNRAEGLWKEVNADHYAKSAADLLKMAATVAPRVPSDRPVSSVKKRRRRRRAETPVAAEATA